MERDHFLSNGLPWYQVSDLKGANSVVHQVYNEYGPFGPKTATPNLTNVLLDNTGKVIAYDKTGVELQWYLSKILGE